VARGSIPPGGLPDVCVAIVREAPDAILVVDDQGRLVYVNGQAERTFGWRRDELIGEPVERLVPAGEREGHAARREGYLRQPRLRQMGQGRLQGVRKDGSLVYLEIALNRIASGAERYTIAIARDVDDRVAEEERLRHLSTHDGLTDLYNRAFFDAEVDRLARGRRTPISVVVIDVDELKRVNDRHGHAAGDQHLRRLAAVLRSAFRGDDVVARLGGDEFCVIMPGVSPEDRDRAVRRFREDLRRHNDVAAGGAVEVSIGSATAKVGPAVPAALRAADERMYAAKRAKTGRRRHSIH